MLKTPFLSGKKNEGLFFLSIHNRIQSNYLSMFGRMTRMYDLPDVIVVIFFFFFFFKDFIYLFMRDRKRVRERSRLPTEKRVQHKTPSQDPGIMTGAEGRCPNHLSHPGPLPGVFFKTKFCFHLEIY